VDLRHASGDRRRDLDGGLVRLDFQEGRILLDEQLDDLGLGQSFAQVGEHERSRHRG